MSIEIIPIGVIRTPFKFKDKLPIQSTKSEVMAEVEVFAEYSDGLESLDVFSHIMLLYWFHKAKSPKLKVTPFLDTCERGLFSTRAPSRPNPIGLSIVKIIQIVQNIIRFEGADMLNGTPLIDIKPFIPEFDNRPEANSGWLAESMLAENHNYHDDDRFRK